MMRKLGIIGAMDVEVETLLAEMEQVTSAKKAGSIFHEGVLMGLPVVLVQCGVGKVNAALCVQILCDCFGVTHLVNTGIAGSLCAQLDIGDLVVSRDAMYHLTASISAIPSARFRGWMSSRFPPMTRCSATPMRRRRR